MTTLHFVHRLQEQRKEKQKLTRNEEAGFSIVIVLFSVSMEYI